jgi:hypothetical protein
LRGRKESGSEGEARGRRERGSDKDGEEGERGSEEGERMTQRKEGER